MEHIKAYQALVEDYLSQRHVSNSNYERIRDIIVDDLIHQASSKDLDETLLYFNIVSSQKDAFIDAGGLDYIADQIAQTIEEENIPEREESTLYSFELTSDQQQKLNTAYDFFCSDRRSAKKRTPLSYKSMRGVLSSHQ